MKKFFIIISIVFFFLTGTVPVIAQTPATSIVPKQKESGKAMRAKSKMVTGDLKIDNLKQRAENEIERRVTALTDIINRISKIVRLNDAQKTGLTSKIQSEIEMLNDLGTKIRADTDIDTLRSDVKSIISSYRVYLLYLPQTRIIIAGDGILNTADKLSQIAGKLQTRITEVKNAGTDTATLETLLTDMQSKINDAKTQTNSVISSVTVLQPTDYPGNKTDLQTGRGTLETAWKDLQIAKEDAKKIMTALQKLNKDSKKASESPVPTDKSE